MVGCLGWFVDDPLPAAEETPVGAVGGLGGSVDRGSEGRRSVGGGGSVSGGTKDAAGVGGASFGVAVGGVEQAAGALVERFLPSPRIVRGGGGRGNCRGGQKDRARRDEAEGQTAGSMGHGLMGLLEHRFVGELGG